MKKLQLANNDSLGTNFYFCCCFCFCSTVGRGGGMLSKNGWEYTALPHSLSTTVSTTPLGWIDFWRKKLDTCHSHIVPNCYRTPNRKFHFEMLLFNLGDCSLKKRENICKFKKNHSFLKSLWFFENYNFAESSWNWSHKNLPNWAAMCPISKISKKLKSLHPIQHPSLILSPPPPPFYSASFPA